MICCDVVFQSQSASHSLVSAADGVVKISLCLLSCWNAAFDWPAWLSVVWLACGPACQRSFINRASFLIGWISCPSAPLRPLIGRLSVFCSESQTGNVWTEISYCPLTVYNEGLEAGLFDINTHKHILYFLCRSQSLYSFLHNTSSSNCPIISLSCKEITD